MDRNVLIFFFSFYIFFVKFSFSQFFLVSLYPLRSRFLTRIVVVAAVSPEEAREPKETAMAPAMEREERTEGGMMGRKLQQVRPAVLPCPALP